MNVRTLAAIAWFLYPNTAGAEIVRMTEERAFACNWDVISTLIFIQATYVNHNRALQMAQTAVDYGVCKDIRSMEVRVSSYDGYRPAWLVERAYYSEVEGLTLSQQVVIGVIIVTPMPITTIQTD